MHMNFFKWCVRNARNSFPKQGNFRQFEIYSSGNHFPRIAANGDIFALRIFQRLPEIIGLL